jgi:hypothetical protein
MVHVDQLMDIIALTTIAAAYMVGVELVTISVHQTQILHIMELTVEVEPSP